MGLDVSHTLLSHDVFSCAWSPLTSSSSSCCIGQQLAWPHIKRRRVARNIFASVSLFFFQLLDFLGWIMRQSM